MPAPLARRHERREDEVVRAGVDEFAQILRDALRWAIGAVLVHQLTEVLVVAIGHLVDGAAACDVDVVVQADVDEAGEDIVPSAGSGPLRPPSP